MQIFPMAPTGVKELSEQKSAAMIFENPGECADYMEAHDYTRGGAGSWTGWQSGKDACRMARTGDMNTVPLSDKLMDRLAHVSIDSSRFRWRDELAGAVPNVPAYIAGQPLAMRSRHRDRSAAAPLCIVTELTTSGGYKAEQLAARGVAILTLTRLLTATRPVELYTLTGLGGAGKAGFILCRVETTPLDLATAAHVMTSAAWPRAVHYGALQKSEFKTGGGWPFGDFQKHAKHMRETVRRFLPHADEVLAIPPAHYADREELDANPVAWVEKRLAIYGPQLEGEAA